jgi:chorismate synthase
MGRLRYLTAGESHGEALIGILDGMPSGLSLLTERNIDPVLAERQKGYGRSHRQKIESDKAKILSGVRFGVTTGAPIALIIENKDWVNWKEKMSVDGEPPADLKRVTLPRPGHADLVGAIKYGHTNDVRNAYERASARETAMRVAIGAIANTLLRSLGVSSLSYVKSIGHVTAETKPSPADIEQIQHSPVRTADKEAEVKMMALIDEAKEKKDTLGGVVEVVFTGLPIGVGSSMQWHRKLDAKLAESLMSIQAVKSVEIGGGQDTAFAFGSEVHDDIVLENGKIKRSSNNAGGLEGGMTNGEPLVLRVGMKPISTLMQPLPSVDLATMTPAEAHIERSDVCAVPALSVIAEYVAALTIADAILDTFGGDTVTELRERIEKRRNGI